MSIPILPVNGVTLTLFAAAVVLCLELLSRSARHPILHFLSGVVLGTVLSFILRSVVSGMLTPDFSTNGYTITGCILLILACWQLLFGNWESRTKATVLGVFILWLSANILLQKTPFDRVAHLIAIAVAAIPAVIWCRLFLSYHRERLSVVLMLFFGGMLSTVPVLFYDLLVRKGISLQFFFFSLTPQSFNLSAQNFVTGQLGMSPGVGMSVLSLFLSFILVGIIEEGSKFWIFKKAGKRFITSIDDAMQFAILVAIGFAFAENILNTGYFVGFVKEYLLVPDKRDWIGFLGNVTGRSVLTSMVHIVSTGTLGYFFGLAVFAGPLLREQQARKKKHRIVEELHRILGFPVRSILRREFILTGYALAVVLHALSNFLVSLPDVLPGNPRTLGDLLQSPAGSPFHFLPLLLPPALLYVVGGFSLLSYLFERKESMKERGHLVPVETLMISEEMPEEPDDGQLMPVPSGSGVTGMSSAGSMAGRASTPI